VLVVGVAVLIIVISVMSGFHQQMRETIVSFYPHLHIFVPGSTVTNYSSVISRVSSNPNVKGAAPFIIGPVLLETQPQSGPSAVWAPNIRGVDPEAEKKVSVLPSKVVQGEFNLRGRGIVIGTTFAEKMNLQLVGANSLLHPLDRHERAIRSRAISWVGTPVIS
jgi:lipoprotein-releasing system permease protein